MMQQGPCAVPIDTASGDTARSCSSLDSLGSPALGIRRMQASLGQGSWRRPFPQALLGNFPSETGPSTRPIQPAVSGRQHGPSLYE